ncbi:MAG: preprotein translocase subunit YajC [Oscillospiraceae bacterium]|nr:preprotein translocase subunit YajC [Oscillospiraceae bacterium]
MEGLSSLIPMIVILGLMMYFMIWRPEKKKKKEEEALRNSLQVGDKITTIGGICGKIVEIDAENIVIETSKDRVRMELKKWSVMTNDSAVEKAKKARAEAQAAAKERAAQKKREKEDKNIR